MMPGDPGFEDARHVWNGMIDLHPAAIAMCASVADVQHAVDFARNEGIDLSIRSGGHNAAGLSLVEGGLVIDLSRMKGVTVDPNARIARVQGGATWASVDQATTEHGLATTGGVISTTGVGGLTLGGGIGAMMRKYGLACDNLLEAQVVLANGEVVTANANAHPDLYWALRGGGGNFGVVTEFVFQLHPMPGLFGGMVIHPRDNAKAVLQNLRSVAETAPDELAIFCALAHSPDGAPVVAYVPWYLGSEEEAQGPMRQVREFGSPLADMTAPTSYVTVQSSLDAGFPPGMRNYWKAHFLNGLPDDAIDIVVHYANAAPSALSSTLFETLGGAVGRVAPDATAFAHRNAPFNLAIIGCWLDPAEDDVNIAWARAFFAAMQPYATGAYVNYLGVGDEPQRVGDAYAAPTYARLRQIKRVYDPENLFRRNQNIPPA